MSTPPTPETHPDDRPPAATRTSKLRTAWRTLNRFLASRAFAVWLLIVNGVAMADSLTDDSAWWLAQALIMLLLCCMLFPGSLLTSSGPTLTVTFDRRIIDPPPMIDADDALAAFQAETETATGPRCACAESGVPCPRPRAPGRVLCVSCLALDCPTRL